MLRQILLSVAALGAALVAGSFFAFSTFIVQSLARLPPAQGIAAMQSINVVVVRSLFIAVFVGTAVVSLGVAGSAFSAQGPLRTWLVVGGLLYVVGSFGVTMAFNVPRNNALAALDATLPTSAAAWESYVSSWTSWNHVRTFASAAAAIAFVIAARLSPP